MEINFSKTSILFLIYCISYSKFEACINIEAHCAEHLKMTDYLDCAACFAYYVSSPTPPPNYLSSIEQTCGIVTKERNGGVG